MRQLSGFPFNIECRRPRASLAAVLVAAATAIGVGGCAVSLPPIASRGDITGSIGAPVSPLSSSLDAEDWRRAQGALAVALDPQGNGEAVDWSNPDSGAKGSFVAVGDAYATADKICRAFLADLVLVEPAEKLQGTGCRGKDADWTIVDVKPWHKS